MRGQNHIKFPCIICSESVSVALVIQHATQYYIAICFLIYSNKFSHIIS